MTQPLFVSNTMKMNEILKNTVILLAMSCVICMSWVGVEWGVGGGVGGCRGWGEARLMPGEAIFFP